ncbi:hypothetical protein F5X99DRAFT_244249 [Biscogniauxia marginata]|nr:hypothetical protein F5X99DRAFT_244249 [Biscogniauxia marginata]
MAILKEVPGVEVTVQVNDRDAIEYDDPHASEQESDAASPTSHNYIESIDDANFSVCVVATSQYRWGYPYHDIELKVLADGQFIRCQFISERDLTAGRCVRSIKGRRAFDPKKKEWYQQLCRFAAVSTVDDSKRDRVQSDKKVAAKLGVIEVRLRRIRNSGNYRRLSPQDFPAISTQSDRKYEIAEKSMKGKAISHGTAFSRGAKMSAPRHYDVEPIPGDRGNLAVYRFYYKSRDALKQEMIIPRSPSPDPIISGLSRAEIERLARERLDQIKGEGEAKRERKSGVKREADEMLDLTGEQTLSRPSKRHQPVVVDLTAD